MWAVGIDPALPDALADDRPPSPARSGHRSRSPASHLSILQAPGTFHAPDGASGDCTWRYWATEMPEILPTNCHPQPEKDRRDRSPESDGSDCDASESGYAGTVQTAPRDCRSAQSSPCESGACPPRQSAGNSDRRSCTDAAPRANHRPSQPTNDASG